MCVFWFVIKNLSKLVNLKISFSEKHSNKRYSYLCITQLGQQF